MKNRAHLSIVRALVLAFSFGVFSGLHAAPLQGNKSAERTDNKKTEQKSAAATPDQRQMRDLDEQVQQTKSDVLSIAAELNQLEEKLLYPSGTQVAIFVALAKGDERLLPRVLFQLGVADFQFGKASKNTAMMKDALKFSQQAAAMKSPVQTDAQNNVKSISKALGGAH